MVTLEDVVERLYKEDEVTVLELLEITTEELVDTFKWKLEDIGPKVIQELSDMPYQGDLFDGNN